MFLGNRLREARENKELTQEEVAKLLGITQGSYGHYEKQRRVPNKDLVLRMAELLGVQEGYFYDNQNIDRVRERINELKQQGILQSADDVTGSVGELILEALRTELKIKELKKGQGK